LDWENLSIQNSFFIQDNCSCMNMYFVAIVLPEELDKKVLRYKQYMFEKFGSAVGLKSPAHITLIPPFWMEPGKEEQLIKDIEGFSSFNSYVAQTDNFSAFKLRTIFIALAPNEAFSQLKKSVDEFFRNNQHYKIKVDERPFHPHITIATRDLHKKDFAEAWPYFAEKKFQEEWMVKGISVLRHNKKNWDVIFTSQFQNL
jgi:2'-5' RNA ligase